MVLVTYATKYGSTEEVARAVAEAIRETGVDVDIRLMRNVSTLQPYDGVVLGAALYMGRLHSDARHFLSEHGDALQSRPVALFALGPVENTEKDWKGAREQLKKELDKLPWFDPISTQVFGGTFNPAKLGFPLNLIPPLRKIPASDARDWDAIRSWAREQAALLEPVAH